jgi:curved DNA-binding protein CbpA
VKLFEPWLGVLDLERWADLTEKEITAVYREKAKSAHPDGGGSDKKMQRLNRAKKIAMAFVRVKIRGEHITTEGLRELFA